MSKIGQLKEILRPDGTKSLQGFFTTAVHHIEFELRPSDRRTENAPTHDIYLKGAHGKWANVGAAWKQEIRRGASTGSDMFSLSFNDPDLPNFKLSAFPVRHGEWVIQRERPRGDNLAAPVKETELETASST